MSNALMMLRRSQMAGKSYVKFADPEVKRVLMEHIPNDGKGLTLREIQAVTSIGTWFKGNTEITSFDEFEKFKNVTSLGGAFDGCTSLAEISIPNSIIGFSSSFVFRNTTSLAVEMIIPFVTGEVRDSFYKSGVVGLVGGFTSASRVGEGAFASSSLEYAVLPNLTNSGDWAFRNCSNLTSVFYGEAMTTIASWTFNNCTNLATLVCLADEPPALNSNTIPPAGCSIYVKETSVDKYKAATNWASRADNIKPISEIPTNTTFYERIKDYL